MSVARPSAELARRMLLSSCTMEPTKHTTLRMMFAIALFGAVTSACAHAHEGPMEKAGRKTDNAAHDVKEGTKNAADDVK
jgi:hypothetical protein